MTRSPEKFARLLTQAIHRIALNENRKVKVVQDELGYALGRDTGGSAVEYWRKGNVPARAGELEQLGRELLSRGGFIHPDELEQFVQNADYPELYPRLLPLLSTFPPNRPAAGKTPGEHPPFIAGPPVTHPRYFFGREREIKRLFNQLRHRPLQNAAIIGPPRSGKTSLLHYLKSITTTPAEELRPGQRADWLSGPERYHWVYVDFQDTRLGTPAGLLGYLLQHLPLPAIRAIPPVDLAYFLDVVGSHLRAPTVILLDEIGVALQRYPQLDNPFWESLRALATNQVEGNLAFILAAPETPINLAHHQGLGSPFFNIFGYTATLGPLREEEARQLIASSPHPFLPADTDWILAESRGWPLLLQILCRERLLSLQEGETGHSWREEGLNQMQPFREYFRDFS